MSHRRPDLDDARAWLRAHRSDAVPDAGFAARVASRLERRPEDELGPAALRLLPAALALTAAVGAVAVVRALDAPATTAEAATDTGTAEAAAPTEDLLAWVLGEELE